MKTIIVLLLNFILAISFADAKNWFVNDLSLEGDVFTSKKGDLTGDGSSDAPFALIAQAVDLASPDDVIYVDAGYYSGQLFNLNKRLTLRGAKYGQDARTRNIAQGETVITAALKWSNVAANGVVVDGFTFKKMGPYYALGIWAEKEVVVINNYFVDNVLGLSPRGNCRVQYNRFVANNQVGGTSGCAIYTDWPVDGLQILDNVFEQNDNTAIMLIGLNEISKNIEIARNRILSGGTGIALVDQIGSTKIEDNFLTDLSTAIVFKGSTELRLSGKVEVNGNYIEQTEAGITVRAGNNITDGLLEIQQNHFSQNTLHFLHQGSGEIAANCNWLSEHSKENSLIVGPVNYAPFLIEATDQNPQADGFQPLLGSCSDKWEELLSEITDEENALQTNNTLVLDEKVSIQVYPNPITQKGRIEISGTAATLPKTIRIYDTAGRLVKKIQLAEGLIFEIEKEEFQDALYLFQLFVDGQLLGAGKFIIM